MFFAKIGKTDEEKFLAFKKIKKTYKFILTFCICMAIFVSAVGFLGIIVFHDNTMSILEILIYDLFLLILGFVGGYIIAWYLYMLSHLNKDLVDIPSELQSSKTDLVNSYVLGGDKYVEADLFSDFIMWLPFFIALLILIFTAPLNALFRLPEYIIIPKRMKEKN